MIEGLYRSPGGPGSAMRASDLKMAGYADQHAREKNMRAGGVRPPRRAQSTFDYVYPTPTSSFGRGESPRTVLVHQNSSVATAVRTALASADTAPQRPPTIDEETAVKGPAAATAQELSAQPAPTHEAAMGLPQKPKLGKPRRSYSVQDYEPVPPTQLPSVNLAFGDLPPELHYAVFDVLDPIDSTCLGLTSKHFYAIHRRMHGTVSLSARRHGPNDMEWVWHLASRVADAKTGRPITQLCLANRPAADGSNKEVGDTAMATVNALSMLRIRGQALCRKCGVQRCELHRHIKDWMGPGYEYCTVRAKYGPAAPAGAKEYCYLSNPKDPHRCGRHRVAKSRPSTPQPSTPRM